VSTEAPFEEPPDDDWVDEIPEAGDEAAVNHSPETLVHVVGEHQLTAGKIVTDGETIAEKYDVAEDRRVVMAVTHDDIAASHLETTAHPAVVKAVGEAALIPKMYPVSVLAPLPDELYQRMQRQVAEVEANVD